MKEKLLWDACGGIPGCNHPQGQQCDCPCHIPDVTKKEEAWKDELHLFWLGNKLGGRPHNEEEWKLFISYIISKAVEEARKQGYAEGYIDGEKAGYEHKKWDDVMDVPKKIF